VRLAHSESPHGGTRGKARWARTGRAPSRSCIPTRHAADPTNSLPSAAGWGPGSAGILRCEECDRRSGARPQVSVRSGADAGCA
jgi:hypothetical protein